MSNTAITVAHGDGIGPEIMDATLHILKAAGARIDIETIAIGEKVYLAGNTAGIPPEAWEILRRTKVFLKAPITTPQGGGFKSLNVATRKTLGLYANVRPCVSYSPFVDTKHPKMDVVIVRENEEDLYAGIEYQQTDEVVTAIKLITRPGSEKIVRYAFEYARANGRKKVTCFTKDNIMKLTDGLFHRIFEKVATEYSDIENEHWIVDIGAAKLADTPENFDVIVLPNLYGDIFHGSAPRRAGQNLANPSGLLLGAVLMLNHINQPDVAELVHNAWLTTLEQGIHTYDIYKEGVSREKVGTKEFAEAVAKRVGQLPQTLKPVKYKAFEGASKSKVTAVAPSAKVTVGVDIYIDYPSKDAKKLGDLVKDAAGSKLSLSRVSNRGLDVWPTSYPESFLVDQFRCRFLSNNYAPLSGTDIVELQSRVLAQGLSITKTENLVEFDGVSGYSEAAKK
jgi:isocitrate dehydrogenase